MTVFKVTGRQTTRNVDISSCVQSVGVTLLFRTISCRIYLVQIYQHWLQYAHVLLRNLRDLTTDVICISWRATHVVNFIVSLWSGGENLRGLTTEVILLSWRARNVLNFIVLVVMCWWESPGVILLSWRARNVLNFIVLIVMCWWKSPGVILLRWKARNVLNFIVLIVMCWWEPPGPTTDVICLSSMEG